MWSVSLLKRLKLSVVQVVVAHRMIWRLHRVSCLCPTPAVNAFRNFLQNALSKKKRKVNLECVLVKKRNEQMKLRKQVSDLQEKIRVLTQQLSAKELVLDALTQEIETLTKEYTKALE